MTPDALVLVNGDIMLPGCATCNGQVDLQKFVTDVGVEAGVEPGAASANFSLSVPAHDEASFARDAKYIMRPGLEVTIYMRGYFPTRGMYANLAEPESSIGEAEVPEGASEDFATLDNPFDERKRQFSGASPGPQVLKGFKSIPRTEAPYQMIVHESTGSSVDGAVRALLKQNLGVHYAVGMDGTVYQFADPSTETVFHTPGLNDGSVGIEFISPYSPGAAAEGAKVIPAPWAHGGQYVVPPVDQLEVMYALTTYVSATYGMGSNTDGSGGLEFAGVKGDSFYIANSGANPESSGVVSHYNAASHIKKIGEDPHSDGGFPTLYMALRSRGKSKEEAYNTAIALASSSKNEVFLGPKGNPSPPVANLQINKVVPEATVNEVVSAGDLPLNPLTKKELDQLNFDRPVEIGASLLDKTGLTGSGLDELIGYPYYHTFRGVVTSVNHSWAPGSGTIQVSCGSMLHFWEYHKMSTNASVMGAKPDNGKLRMSVMSHVFSKQHPYQIMYTLHHDMAGSAGGVAWALQQAGDQDAKSTRTNESFFSYTVKYWEQRFKARETKLRLHGLNGDLFSAAQSAFLARLSASQLSTLLKNRFPGVNASKDPNVKGLLEASQAVALTDKLRRGALTQSLGIGDSKVPEINLSEMHAFSADLTTSTISLFESTYESKLDVAQSVTTVTGFEFYQDVDGDLVFKPPFYNLDTSGSRAYRIEPIDIINFNPSEDEPQATYIKGTNGLFANIQIGAGEGEYGNIGTYIDYRLVAQYGWRPADFSTSFLNDAKALYYSGANRLDVMNAPTKRATLTIPLRPELRPGYPVYIVNRDCFYYINSFSHSFAPGAQATTTLSLIAKRSKFAAPGFIGKGVGGISAIRLDRPDLPERLLEVLDNDGRPRKVGFPNVVMALDPKKINPLHYVSGLDLSITDAAGLDRMLDMAVHLGILRKDGSDQDVYVMDMPGTLRGDGTASPKAVRFYFGKSEQIPEGTINARENLYRVAKPSDQELEKATNALGVVNEKREAAKKAGTSLLALEEERTKLQDRATTLQALKDGDLKAFEATLNEAERAGVALIAELIRQVGSRYKAQNSDFANLDSTISILEMLSEKKSHLSNASQPGEYRYYSASHPDPESQGQAEITYDSTSGGTQIIETPLDLDPAFAGIEVKGFRKEVSLPYPGAYRAEAELGKVRPTRGIRVLTADPSRPRGVSVPTSEIREIRFSSQLIKGKKNVTSSQKVYSLSREAGVETQDYFETVLSDYVQRSAPDFFVGVNELRSLSYYYEKAIEPIVVDVAEAQVTQAILIRPPAVPLKVRLGKDEIDLQKLFDSFDLADVPKRGSTAIQTVPPIEQSLPSLAPVPMTPRIQLQTPKASTWTTAEFASRLAKPIAKALVESFNANLRSWLEAITKANWTPEQVEEAWSLFTQQLEMAWGIKIAAAYTKKTVTQANFEAGTHSAIFPVSDANGFEVIGSFRYGRDVSISPDGVWANLHAQDPLSLLDRQLVEEVTDFLTRGVSVSVPQPALDEKGRQKMHNGVPVFENRKLVGVEAGAALEQKVIDALRKRNLSDTQILDLFGAKPGSDGDHFQIGLANMFSNGLGSLDKIPIVNAAKTLTDIRVTHDGQVCSCKASEAAITLDLFGSEEFLELDSTDKYAQVMRQQAELKSVAWRQAEDSFSGKSLERRESVLKSTLDPFDKD
jgi:hypothetical protein